MKIIDSVYYRMFIFFLTYSFIYVPFSQALDSDLVLGKMVEEIVQVQNEKNGTQYEVGVPISGKSSISFGVHDEAKGGQLVNYYKFEKSENGLLKSVSNIHGSSVDLLEDSRAYLAKSDELKKSGRYSLKNRKSILMFSRELKIQSKSIIESIQNKVNAMEIKKD